MRAFASQSSLASCAALLLVATGCVTLDPAPPVACKTGADCAEGEFCSAGVCKPGAAPPEVTACEGTDWSCPVDGEACRFERASVNDLWSAACGPPNDAPGAVGDGCIADAACAGGRCETEGGTNFCTQICNPGGLPACPARHSCVREAGGGRGHCGPASSACTSTSDCLVGELCALLHDGALRAECVPIDPSLGSIGSACTDDGSCATGLCSKRGGWGVCVPLCDPDDLRRETLCAVQVRGSACTGLVPEVGVHHCQRSRLGSGEDHSCAIRTDGEVSCWGADFNGQLGNGTAGMFSGDPVTVQLPDALRAAKVIQLAGGFWHTCALDGDGGVWCWGTQGSFAGDSCDLSSRTADSRVAPVRVQLEGGGDLSGAVQLTAAGQHACALVEDGSSLVPYCWGVEELGRLGRASCCVDEPCCSSCLLDGDGFLSCSATSADSCAHSGLAAPIPGPGDVAEVAAGTFQTCLLSTDGAVTCFGFGYRGALLDPALLPDRSTYFTSAPTRIGGLAARTIAGGRDQSCATTAAGVSCFGRNTSGESAGRLPEGDDDEIFTGATPVQGSRSLVVRSGAGVSCGLEPDGAVGCWGSTSSALRGQDPAQAGVARGVIEPMKVPAVGGVGTLLASDLSLGKDHGCAVLASGPSEGAVACWGEQVARRAFGPTAAPRLDGLTGLTLGSRFGCGIGADRQARCFGVDSFGNLGRVSLAFWDEQLWPAPIVTRDLDALPDVEEVRAGLDHACARTGAGGVFCWGMNWALQLGDSPSVLDFTTYGTAAAIPALLRMTGLGLGPHTSCALDEHHEVLCWGRDDFEQVGPRQSTIDQQIDPSGFVAPCTREALAVPGLGPARRVGAGATHTCALGTDGQLRCAGRNLDGELGGAAPGNGARIFELGAETAEVIDFSVGNRFTCALTRSGSVWCAGSDRPAGYPEPNLFGALGRGGAGAPIPPGPPQKVVGLDGSGELVGATALAGNETHTCAILGGGKVACWGVNGFGQLGFPDYTSRSVPTVLQAPEGGELSGVTELVAGGALSCARRASGWVCWGDNSYGELMTGPVDAHVPVIRLPR